MDDLLVVLTARCGSERLKNKSIAEVDGQPLICWVVERFAASGFDLILATTSNKEDDALESIGKSIGLSVWRHPDPNDVVGRMEEVRRILYPDAKYVFRALGDCPFYATELLIKACEVLGRFRGDAFCWMLPPENLPVYGAREFPYSSSGWKKIVDNSAVREHVDHYYATHRDEFNVIYHEAPNNVYFRPPTYRLEVDYPEDLEFVRQVAKGVGMLAPLPKVIQFLDENPDVVQINSHCQEKTGPLVSFTHQQRREWFAKMRGHPIVDWEGRIWKPPSDKAQPIFCSSGTCLIGFAERGRLHTKEGHDLGGPDRVMCNCGAGKVWHTPIHSR